MCANNKRKVNNLHTYDGAKTQDIIFGDVFFEILEPEDLEYTYRVRPAKDFGPTFSDNLFARKRNDLVLAEPREACTKLTNDDDVDGNVVLIERGECSFLSKVILAEEAGAIGAIITDTKNREDVDYYIEMVHDNTDRDTNIPAGYLMGQNGRMIMNTLDKHGLDRAIINIPVNLTFVPTEEINHPPWAMS